MYMYGKDFKGGWLGSELEGRVECEGGREEKGYRGTGQDGVRRYHGESDWIGMDVPTFWIPLLDGASLRFGCARLFYLRFSVMPDERLSCRP